MMLGFRVNDLHLSESQYKCRTEWKDGKLTIKKCKIIGKYDCDIYIYKLYAQDPARLWTRATFDRSFECRQAEPFDNQVWTNALYPDLNAIYSISLQYVLTILDIGIMLCLLTRLLHKRCQRHNGPRGWVLWSYVTILTPISMKSHLQNLDQNSYLKINTKLQPQNLD